MACYGRAAAGGDTRVIAQVALTSSGLQYPVFNSAMLTGPVTTENELRKLIAIPQVHFRARGLGWSYWVCEDLLSEPLRNAAASIFKGIGMKPVAHAPGMHADRIRHEPIQAADLRCVCVDNEQTRATFARLASVVFALPPEIAATIYESSTFWSSHVCGYLGYANRDAVSIVSTVVFGGVAGVYSLGTLPAHRGRGYARALLRHALADTERRNTYDGIVLQTNTHGMTLYKNLGFKAVTLFTIYLGEGGGSQA